MHMGVIKTIFNCRSDALNDPAISCLSTLESANQTLVTGVSEEPCLSVSFKCEFPRIMTVTSDSFQVRTKSKYYGNMDSKSVSMVYIIYRP